MRFYACIRYVFLVAATTVSARAPVPYTADQFQVTERRDDGLIIDCDARRLPWPALQELVAMLAIPEGTLPQPVLLQCTASITDTSGYRLITPAAMDLDDASRQLLSNLVRIQELDVMRDLSLAKLIVSPTQPSVFSSDPSIYYEHVRFWVPYPRALDTQSPSRVLPGTDFTDLLNAFVLNAFDRPLLRIAPPLQKAPVHPPRLTQPSCKVLTTTPSVYALPVAAVDGIALIGAAANRVLVESATEAVAVTVARKEPTGGLHYLDGEPLQADDCILWYAPQSTSPYSREVAWWVRLAAAGESAPKAEVRPMEFGSAMEPARVRFHAEHDAVFPYENGETDAGQAAWWMWDALLPPGSGAVINQYSASEPTVMRAAFEIPNVPHQPSTGTIKLRLLDDQHQPRTALDDVTVTWCGETVVSASADAPSATHATWDFTGVIPPDGAATLTAAYVQEATKAHSGLYLDWIEVTYCASPALQGKAQVWKPLMTDASRFPVRDATVGTVIAAIGADRPVFHHCGAANNGTPALALPAGTNDVFAAPLDQVPAPRIARPPAATSSLLDPANGADYLVVTHPLFRPQAKALAALHAETGLRTAVIATDEIYDTFGYGATGPEAIRAFLLYALDYWQQPGPTYVVLFGDASWDYWGRFAPAVPNYVPSYRLESEGARHFYPSDNWYACLHGNGILPDVHIGRLPVQDATSAQTVVDKTAAYLKNAEPGAWHSRFLFLTDDTFEDYADQVIESKLGPSVEFEEIRFQDYPFTDNVYLPDEYVTGEWERHRELVKASPPLTQELVERINDGMLVLEYFGHGSPNVLGHERVLFGGGSKFSDVPRLKNGNRLPFLVAWTCETGYFDFAEPKWNVSIGEDLLKAPQGGAVLLYVASGRGYSDQHLYLASGLHEGLFHRGLRNVGDLVAASKLACAALSSFNDPIKMFLLLGDPAANLPLPRRPTQCRITPNAVDGDKGGTIEVYVPRLFITPVKGPVTITAEDQRGHAFLHRTLNDWPLDKAITEGAPVPPGLSAGPARVVVYASAGGGDISPPSINRDISPPSTKVDELFAGGSFDIVYHDPPAPPDALPNLVLRTENVRVVNADALYTGMTLLVDATIINDGSAVAHKVSAVLEPVERGNQRPGKAGVIDRLRAGESKTLRLRFDSYNLTGEQQFAVAVNADQAVREATDADNRVDFSVHYRGKPDLALAPGDLRKTQHGDIYLLTVPLHNIGEAPAQGIYYENIGSTAISVGVEFQRPDGAWTSVDPSPAFAQTIAPGQTYLPDKPVAIPRDAIRVRVTVDDPDYVDESNRGNNTIEIDIAEIQEEL